MSTARKVIDWRRQDAAEAVRVLRDLPEGRYVLVPEDEVSLESADEDLPPEEIAAIHEGIDAADRAEQHDWHDVREELDVAIAKARARRAR